MKILIYDIETKPIIAHVWGLWDNNVGLNQIESDWSVLSWAAKWLDEKEVMYQDNRKSKNLEDDKKLLRGIWELLDEADIVITQNGKAFDQKKLNARFIFHGMKPPSSAKHIDTKILAKKHFAFSSNSLEFMTSKLNTKYKKLKHKRFPGHELWTQCLKGNVSAWKEMERYNKHDVLATEELYKKLIPWDSSVNFNVFTDSEDLVCSCGSTNFQKRGYYLTQVSKFQRYQCQKCGSWMRSRTSVFSKEKRQSLKIGVVR